MIESLTPEQEAQYDKYVEIWTDHGLCTEPADRPRAEAAINKMYECGGLPPPKKIIWCGSPLSMQIAYECLKKGLDLKGLSEEEAIQEMRDALKGVQLNLQDIVYGSHDASWLSFYAYFREVCSLVEETNLLEGLTELAKSAGWAIPCEDICFVSERHTLLIRDGEGLLHCDTGPSVRYPDGFSVYSWHGVLIPSEWIEQKETLTADVALTWANIEQRRCAAEILGWEKILQELSPVVVDQDTPDIGTLYQVDLPDSPNEKFLKVLCGTGRTFVLSVPPEMKTALEANAWTYGVDTDTIRNLEIRT
jgi:hypothetical protein